MEILVVLCPTILLVELMPSHWSDGLEGCAVYMWTRFTFQQCSVCHQTLWTIDAAAAFPAERLSWDSGAECSRDRAPVSPTRREIPEVTFLPFLRLLKSVQKCVLIVGLVLF